MTTSFTSTNGGAEVGMMNKHALRVIRAVKYASSYLFLELPRGLDFSRRDKSQVSSSWNHGYALTSKKALQDMLSHIDFAGKRFVDIGSGKGGVICFAHELGLSYCEGIEYEQHLHDIAVSNIEKLGYHDSVKSTHIDARRYTKYADFDIYFIFNPFDHDIYEQVLAAIITQNRASLPLRGAKHLVCYGSANLDAVESSGCFSLVTEQTCRYRGNKYRIFRLELS